MRADEGLKLARLFVIVGGLIVLALMAALVVPYFVDWSSYRADFEREASAVLGRKVTVQGDATARLLPFPSVTFTDVSVGGGPNGEAAMTVETFSMDAELAPFLRGDFLIFDMRLVRPKVTIDVAADGVVDWAVRPSAPFDASQISIEKLTVTEGQVTLRHAASGRTHRLTEINTQLSAKSLDGPWRVTGSMRLDGMRTAVTINTGKVDSTGDMNLRIQAEPEVQAVAIESEGNLRFDNGAASYKGQFKIAARKDKAEAGGAEQGPGYRINGKFSLDHERLSLDEFLFQTGPLSNPYSADGRGFVDLGEQARFELTVDGAQVRFDEAIGAGEAAGGQTFAERLAATQEALADLPRPAIPGRLEVNLPAVVAGDTTIRDVRLSAEPAADGWTVNSLAATLPGRTTLEANGKLRTDGELGFDGALLLAIAQPSGFAAWVSQDVDDAIRRLPAAGFRANVELTRNHQRFDDLELGLGNATFHGRAESNQPRGARASTVLKLAGGALDVDGLAAFASLFVSDVGAVRFADRDLDLDVNAGPVSVAGLSADKVDAAFRLREGLLEIDRLSIEDLAGATVSATGTIKDFPDDPAGNIDASLVAVDLAPLISAVSERYGGNAIVKGLMARATAYPDLFADARLDVVATSAKNDDRTTGFALSAQGKAGGTALSATLSGNGRASELADADVSLVLSGSNDDATKLLALYGLPVLELNLTGRGETDLTVKGPLSSDLATVATLTADDLSARFDGSTRLADGLLTLKGKASLEAADLEPWLMTAGVGLPGMGAGMPVQLEAEVDVSDGRAALGGLTGTINEGAITGDINSVLKDGKPHVSGQLSLDELNLEPLAAMVLGEAALESGGLSWSQTPFQPAVTAPFTADLTVAAGTVTASPSVSAYDADLSLRLDDEGLRLSDVSAKLFGGAASGMLEIKNNSGTGLFSAQMKLDGADVSALLGTADVHGEGDLSTGLSASGKSVSGLVATLAGSGTAAFRSLIVDGLNPLAFPAFIARADMFGKDIDAATTAQFAPAIAAAGSFAAAPAEAAFTVAGGVMRAPPLTLDNPAASVEADVQADLNTGRVRADGTITYQPGIEALVGSEPALRFSLDGPLGETSPTFDSQPLAQFLTQRALEVEQARVEAMQASLLEKQRLRREVRYYAALQSVHDDALKEIRQQEEEERRKAEAEAEAKRQAEEEARQKAEAEEKQRAAEAERLAEQAEAARRAAEQNVLEQNPSDTSPLIERAPLAPPVEAKPAAEPKPDPAPSLSMDGFMKMLQGTE